MYDVVYRCLLCDKKIRLGRELDVPESELPVFLGKIIKNQLFAGNTYLHQAPMQIPHRCDDGSAGMAWFAGLVKL